MVYTGLIHGATGVVYYAWDSNVTRFGIAPQQQTEIPGRPAATPIQALQAEVLWKTVAQLNRELRQLAPALLSPTISEVEYSVRFEGESITETPIRTLLKPLSKNEWVLLMVNMDDAVLNANLEFDRIIKSAEWMFEGSSVLKREEVGTSFEVLFEPFTTRVLRLQPGGGE